MCGVQTRDDDSFWNQPVWSRVQTDDSANTRTRDQTDLLGLFGRPSLLFVQADVRQLQTSFSRKKTDSDVKLHFNLCFQPM